jgi:hypothetical protein
MNSLVFNAAGRVIEHISELAPGIGVVVAVLVVLLVVERELLRGYGGPASQARVRATDPIVYPLLVALVFILAVRFGQFV